ncbi:hypothetical protein SAY86_032159 [Trapa natans]|uniref:C2H2-type domain-containing protein n=1 Tax=Trapa natans TaxID=22666 RepID=A0AAN7R905_TRANT|nr:hypothetical protein SAY86_032159 [Trapa natans]
MAPTKATVRSFFNKFFSLFFLLLHLGCFFPSTPYTSSSPSSSAADGHPRHPNKKRRLLVPSTSDAVSQFKPHRALSSSWACIKRAFTKTPPSRISSLQQQSQSSPTAAAARPSHHSLHPVALQAEPLGGPESPHSPSSQEYSDATTHKNPLFIPQSNDSIFPCTACGEVFPRSQLLEQHQSIKHAVTELVGDDSGQNIVKIIFETGWTNRKQRPSIHRILKIHNSQKILARFEEYRELVKSKAARNANAAAAATCGRRGGRDERCIADGNELLRFHCSTFMCDLGRDGCSAACNQQYCSICGIIRLGFSQKMDGISTLSTSWRAHEVIPEENLQEFSFMNVKRGMLICRVIAGRVGCDPEDEDYGLDEKGDGGFDSLVGRVKSGDFIDGPDEEELLVFNPRAVLPCFVIVYTV